MSTAILDSQRGDSANQWFPAARAGSPEALGRLLQTCRRYLLDVANSEMKPQFQAKFGASDLVQETYLEAQRIFGRFEGHTAVELRAWLRVILLNKMATCNRQFHGTAKRQIAREIAIDSASDRPQELTARCTTASSVMMRNERTELLMEAMGRLPHDYRQVILWRQIENSSFEDIAGRMGRSVDAVRKLWWRALQQLQTELGDSL